MTFFLSNILIIYFGSWPENLWVIVKICSSYASLVKNDATETYYLAFISLLSFVWKIRRLTHVYINRFGRKPLHRSDLALSRESRVLTCLQIPATPSLSSVVYVLYSSLWIMNVWHSLCAEYSLCIPCIMYVWRVGTLDRFTNQYWQHWHLLTQMIIDSRISYDTHCLSAVSSLVG